MDSEQISDAWQAGQSMGEILLDQFLSGVEGPPDNEELQKWLNKHPAAKEAYATLKDKPNFQQRLMLSRQLEATLSVDHQKIISKIQNTIPAVSAQHKISRKIYYLTGIAASLLIGLGIYLYSSHSHKAVPPSYLSQKTDVAPGTNKAVLILANGNSLILDSLHNGMIGQQGNAKVTSQNGSISYLANKFHSTAISYNTITTGRGGQYQIILSDGTKVWLDAASSLHYPTAFTGQRREVSLMGQAYFEVAHRSSEFIVHTNRTEVKDLGTHFNISAYPDEEIERITLLEGAVSILSDKKEELLHPGQQAQVSIGQHVQIITEIDTDEVVAWKNGRFQFDGANLTTILRSVSRWYDIDVVDNSDIKQHFVLTVPRDVPISTLMKALERTNKLSYKIEGKTLIVVGPSLP